MGAFSYVSKTDSIQLEVSATGPINKRTFQRVVILIDPDYEGVKMDSVYLGKPKTWIRFNYSEAMGDLLIAINVARGRAERGLHSVNNFTIVRKNADPHTTFLSIVARVAVDEKEGVRLSRETRQLSSDAEGANGASVFADVAQKLSCDREYPCPVEWELVPMSFDGKAVPKTQFISSDQLVATSLSDIEGTAVAERIRASCARNLSAFMAGSAQVELSDTLSPAWVDQYLVRG